MVEGASVEEEGAAAAGMQRLQRRMRGSMGVVKDTQ